jgi:hypothetical protein
MSAIDTLRHRIKYPRPTKLSDPYRDFPPDHLTAILAKSDSELTWVEYRNLLGPHLPAGTYEEVMYFLPLAFAFLVKPENEDVAYEVADPLAGFMSFNMENLRNDDLLEVVRECVRECLDIWTSTFTLIDYGREFAWQQRVSRSLLICGMVNALVKFGNHADLAYTFLHELATNEVDPLKPAWFLGYAAFELEEMFFSFVDEIEVSIASIIMDHDLLQNAAKRVQQSSMYAISPAYWQEWFKLFGLHNL